MQSRLILLAVILLAIDFYSYQAFKVVFSDERILKAFWIFTFITIATFITAQLTNYAHWPKIIRTYWTALIFIVYLSKLFILPFLLVDDLVRLGKLGYNGLSGALTSHQGGADLSRARFLSQVGLVVAALPFLTFIKGMITGLDDFTVRNVKFRLAKLPASFNGLRIVQISDLHVGTYLNGDPLKKAFAIIKKLNPDLIFFTGDLVNNLAEEAEPYIDLFKDVTAPMGVYSIMGNHDYGDYHQWPSLEEKQDNHRRFINIHKQAGWKLLLNENTELEKEGEKINLIGLENWGGRNFSKYGNMEKAMTGMKDNPVTILLSHDPSHWTLEVSQKYPDVDITLSGHTHGMQFGIETKTFKWSPVKWVYKHWAGLYNRGSQYLYVNRGMGCIGYPGRVGILPEITLIELANS